MGQSAAQGCKRRETLVEVRYAIAVSFFASTCLLTPARAQVAGGGDMTAPEEHQMDSEDIIVTARKRGESVQQIPIAIDVVSDKTLAATGTGSLLQLESVAPGLNLAKGPSGAEVGVTVR